MSILDLAYFGGSPVVDIENVTKWPAPISSDLDGLRRVINSGSYHRVNHPEIVALEHEFGAWQSRKYICVVSSGGAAIHILMDYIAKINRGSGEVITSILNWPGATSPILFPKLTPIFVDIDPNTGNMDPNQVESKITKDTCAVFVTHLFGNPSNMTDIKQISQKNELTVIEDCAQALGATSYGVKAGNFGLGAAFSGNGAKHLASGELGILATDNDDLANHIDCVSLSSYERRNDRTFAYQSQGYNYRPNVFSAAIARQRLKWIDNQISERIINASLLEEKLCAYPGIVLLSPYQQTQSSYYLFSFRVDHEALGLSCSNQQLRDGIIQLLCAEGVSASCWLKKCVVDYIPQLKGEYGAEQSCLEEAFPMSTSFQNSMIQVKEIAPPQNKEMMELYVLAFEKIWNNISLLENWLCHIPN